MALTRSNEFDTGSVLTEIKLEGEFDNIYNNALSLISPLTGDLAFGGNRLTGLSLGSEGSPALQFTGDANTGIRSSAADTFEIVTAGADRWQITAAGHLLAVDDATYDIGASGATRPRNMFLSGTATLGTALAVASGGTALASGTSGGVLGYTATGTLASSALLTANGVVIGGGAGATPTSLGAMTNGQLVVGSTSAAPVVAAITAGSGITVTNGAGSITVAADAAAYDQLTGLTLSNGTDATNDIDITVGGASSDDAALADRTTMSLTAALGKQLDVGWAVGGTPGTPAGGLDTGVVGNGTYHIFLIKRPDTGVVDALFSLSASAPTMPTNYTKKRRIGSIIRSAGAILLFTHRSDFFELTTPVLDVDITNPGTSAVTRTLASVPTGIVVEAVMNVYIERSTNAFILYLSPLTATDSAASATTGMITLGAAVASGSAGQVRLHTNTSAQIRSRFSLSGAGDALRIATRGWFDTRGRG